MRKQLFVTLLLACGMPLTGNFAAFAAPEPQSQSQAAVTITGTVLDENNEPVIGASVVQKGVQTNAAATDFDGNFSLRVAPGTTLRISYVGYKTVEIAAAQGMMVYLQPTTEQLNELVAIGYGSQKRANLTGAVATVDVARTMDSRPATDVAKALQGAVPGLTITTASGDIAENPTINIRGAGTLSNGHNSSPLIVVDGVVVDDLSFINADDIESISVLKDASSSAIYGSRAAFGVILVQTKQADAKERVSVKYNNNFGWGRATVLPEFNTTVNNLIVAMDNTNTGGDEEIFNMYYNELLPFAQAWAAQHGGKQYTSMVELHPFQDWNNVGDYYCPDPNNMSMPAGLAGWDYSAPFKSGRWLSYADWDVAKTLFGSAFSQKHNVSIEGRSGRSNYRASFGYDEREGLWNYNPDKFKRYMANASIETQIFDFLKAGVRFNFSQREYTAPHTSARAPYQYVWRFPSQFENYGYIVNADGEHIGFRNEITYRMGGYNGVTTTAQTRLQAYMVADIIPGLQLQADFTYQLRDQNSDAARIPFSMYSQWISGTAEPTMWTNYAQGGTYAAESNYRDGMWTANIFGTYNKSFNDNNLKVMLGWTGEREEYRYHYVQRSGLLDYNLPNIELTNGTTYDTSGNHWRRATTGFFGRINYDYKGIYLFEANGRYDSSSRFPASDQWAFFPSFSAGYRFSEENYFNNIREWWSNGKIRASYGHVGNDNVGQNMFLSTISQVAQNKVYWVNGNQMISMSNMPTLVSSSLTWERIITTDFGVDLGFLNNSLNVSFDWFNRETRDMLGLGQQLPQTLGASSPRSNNGTLRTRGWEVSLGWNKSFGDWDVYASFNISDARSKITKWNNATGLIYSYDRDMNGSTGNSYFTPDTYYGDIWGFESDGYFTQGDMTWDAATGTYVPNQGVPDQTALESGTFHYGPGDVRFKDLNGDGVINWGNPDMIELNGRTYVPGQDGYAEAKANPNSEPVPVRSLRNHGDLKIIGNALPRYEYSFHVGGAWKGFDLDLFFQGVGKRDMWATGSTIIPMVQSGYGTFTNQLNYNKIVYAADGQIDFAQSQISQDNDYPRMFSGADGTGQISNIGQGKYNFYPQSKYLTSLAYLRLKNLTFGYTLPANITQKALVQRARIYFSADNLCFLHNGAGKYQLDPEMNSSANATSQGGNGGQGTYGRTVPIQRVLSFGLQVTF
ncbi:MAG: SusC/RagA family TonB-linked outer membrane protein [Muribaculaceae bacterium]|nr:SusC/RagA family TonB-linked outer membrane protein [Muribaculaceae bacterium]